MEEVILKRIRCPKCGHSAQLTTWKPPDGYDPRMREYHCEVCDTEVYVGGPILSGRLRNEAQNEEPDSDSTD